MARLSSKELDQIVKRDMPGYSVVHRAARGVDRRAKPGPDEVAPDISKLRQKYLGESEAEADVMSRPRRGASRRTQNTDDEIVVVQPKRSKDAFDPPSRPKTVVVSGKSKRVIASQG